jgi:hypothetical protein
MIIAPFGKFLCFLLYPKKGRVLKHTGKILFCTHPESQSFPWKVSKYALVLEIREDGLAGDFYFVYNDPDADLPTLAHKDLKGSVTAEAEDDTINFKPFCVANARLQWAR